jgi:hypothetical protein
MANCHILKESAVFKGGFYQGSNVLVLHFFMGTFKGVFCSHLFHNFIIGVFNQCLDVWSVNEMFGAYLAGRA